MKILTMICFAALAGCSLDDAELPQEESQAELSEGAQVDSKHCVIQTSATPIGQDVDSALPSVDSPRCFPSFSQAIDFATKGYVKLPKGATPEDLDEIAMDNDSLASFVIGVEYQHAGYGGSSRTFYSGVSCAGYTHSVVTMPSGWNDVISSARAYSYCNHSYHYEHADFRGSVRDCGTACSYIGDALNDRTSSIRWTR
jgi:hypothetical protein